MTMMWCMVLEIWSMAGTIFCHFGPFFALFLPLQPKKSKFWKTEKNVWRYHFTHVYHKRDNHMMYGSWDMERDGHNFLSFWTVLPFYPPNNPKNQNFEKMKKAPGDITILHMFTINDNHIMYRSWDTECDVQNFLSF